MSANATQPVVSSAPNTLNHPPAKAKTISRRNLSKAEKNARQEVAETLSQHTRPAGREECRDSCRPCPWVSCKHHLYLSVKSSGNLVINHPDKEPWELTESCSLDVAERGESTLEQVGQLLNLTRERIRQIERGGADKMIDSLVELDLVDESMLKDRVVPI